MRALTPEHARDAIVAHFVELQRATFACVEEDLEDAVRADVRAVFVFHGDDFDHPTADGVRRALTTLARLATVWGADESVVASHRAELTALVDTLARAA